MAIPMKRFLQLGIDPQMQTEPKSVLPKPTESIHTKFPANANPLQTNVKTGVVVQELNSTLTEVDKNLPGKDSGKKKSDQTVKKAREIMRPIEYGSLINIFNEYKGYIGASEIRGIPKDQTGYPTNGQSAQMNTEIQTKVLESLIEMDSPSTIHQTLDLAMRLPCRDNLHWRVVDKLATQYRNEIEDPDDHFDIPIVHYIDGALNLGKKCADECGDTEAFKDICRLGDDIINRFEQINNIVQNIKPGEIKRPGMEGVAAPNQRNMNELTPMDPGMRIASYPMYPRETAMRSVWRLMESFEKAETFDEITECALILTEMTENCNHCYEVTETGRLCETDDCEDVMESYSIACAINLRHNTSAVMESSVGANVREAGRNARAAIRTGSTKIVKGANSVKTTAKKTTEPMVKLIADTWDKAKKADTSERREMIIKGGVLPKIWRWMKRAIPISAGLVVGQAIPVAGVLSVVAFIGWLATDKLFDRRIKNQILKELEDEIELCNEKIDDARGDSSKEAKYKLIRIRNKLKRTQDRIRLNLTTASREDDIVTNVEARKKATKELDELKKKKEDEDDDE